MKSGIIGSFVLLMVVVCSTVADAGHWTPPATGTIFMHVAGKITIEGKAPQTGDEVGVFSSDGVLVGLHLFDGTTGLLYGDVAINGDDPNTPGECEGALDGQVLSVKVWSARNNREYGGNEIVIAPTDEFSKNGYRESPLPITYKENEFIGVTISVKPSFGVN